MQRANAEVDYSGGYLSEYVGHSEKVCRIRYSMRLASAPRNAPVATLRRCYLNEMEENGNWWDPVTVSLPRADAQIMESPVETVSLGIPPATGWAGGGKLVLDTAIPSQKKQPGWETATHFRQRQGHRVWGDYA